MNNSENQMKGPTSLDVTIKTPAKLLSGLNFDVRHGPSGVSTFPLRFRERLRELVDEWIDTGRHKGGAECPQDRHNDYKSRAARDALEHLHRFPIFGFLDNHWRLRLILGRHQEVTNGVSDGGLFAMECFLELMASDWRNTIVKCRRETCGRYFQVRNPARTYKRGIYCRNCKQRLSAGEIMQQKRAKLHERRLRAAASALCEWVDKPAPQKRSQLKSYIVTHVNRRVPPEQITAKWVTHNLKEIERTAKEERPSR
jgi:hypothetical protein